MKLSINIKRLVTLAVMVMMLALVGCQKNQATKTRELSSDEAVIHLGMSYDEVNEIVECKLDRGLMISPSNIDRACIINSNSVEVYLAISDGKTVSAIHTGDSKYRLNNGLGVDSTFEDIKNSYSSYKVWAPPGYGRIVVVEGNITFAFVMAAYGSRKISDSEQVLWLELPEIIVKRQK